MTKLEEIRNSLNNYIEEELKKSPPDRDWEAVKPDIADLHLLMSKLIYAQMKLNDS